MSRRTVTSTTTPKSSQPKSPTMKTDLDDWETDPDFIRNIDEMEQRWGSSRTVGSINMNELIDEVRKDHLKMREKFHHPSQRDHSEGFGGKFGIQHDRKDPSAYDYDYHEELAKHSSQEVSRKVVSSKENLFEKDMGNVREARRAFLEKTEKMFKDSRSPPVAPKPDFSDRVFASKPTVSQFYTSAKSTSPTFEESTSRRVITEKKSSSSLAGKELPKAFQSIQEKIDAFKKEFEDIENKVSKKSDLSKVIKKTTEIEKKSNVQYVTRSNDLFGDQAATPSSRISSTSPVGIGRRDDFPKANIKSLSEKFETLCRDDEDDFKRRAEAKRREYFDQIKHQVRETRKGLDHNFDLIDDTKFNNYTKRANDDSKISSSHGKASGQHTAASQSGSPSSRPSSRLSESSQSSIRPKIYTRSETTKEEFVTKIVKENDKIIENETKRNVERQSSCHGSSDEEGEPTSIKFIDQQLRTSPSLQQQIRTESPVDEVKRRVPVVDPEIKGGGLMARTLYDYTAAEDDELSFDVDDLITNIEKVDPGWYKGTITKDGQKKIGLFPANHVKLLNE